MSARELFLIANARMPSQRAQSLQVAHMASGFARAGVRTTLFYARRHGPPPLARDAVLDFYAVPAGPRPELVALSCVDWIERTPRRLQFAPARLQELSFARSAARRAASAPEALVYCREIEAARLLGARMRVFLELHRVPGGRLRRRWLREAAQTCRGIVAISAGVRDDLLELGLDGARIAVEHDAVDLARFATLPGRAAARAELGLAEQDVVCAYTGGLLEWKGVDVLVEAARACPEVRFVIAGGMEADVARIRAAAAGLANVRVDGFQPPARVPLYLAAADLGVVPNRSRPAISARYTSPLKVFEALAAGLPLVVSDLPSLREILASEADAVFAAPDDPAALAAGLRRLAADLGLRRALAARGRERVREHTWDARARRLLAWMEGRP